MRRLLFLLLCAGALLHVGAAQVFAGTNDPILLTQKTSTRAVALDAVSASPEPFSPTSNSFSDQRTRVVLFGVNVTLASGETASAVSATAEDGTHKIYAFRVEYVAPVHNQQGGNYVVIRIHEQLGYA